MSMDSIKSTNIGAQEGRSYVAQEGRKSEKSGSAESIQQVAKEEQEKKSNEELKRELQEVVRELNNEMSPLNREIKFGFEDKIESLYVTVQERSTDKVIRKIPSEEAMELMAKMREIVGIIFDKKG